MMPDPTVAARSTRLAVVAVTALLLAGCSSGTSAAPVATRAAPSTSVAPPSSSTSPSTSPSTTAPSTTVAPLPPVPTPGATGTCPYLSSDDVAAFNGEKVTRVRLDTTVDPPACFFDSFGDSQQLSTWVLRAGSAAEATAVVDRAAPVASTDPADQPAGWTGGSSGGDAGALYAVAKGSVAVVVTSDQAQSVKARRVAEQLITTLGL